MRENGQERVKKAWKEGVSNKRREEGGYVIEEGFKDIKKGKNEERMTGCRRE